MRNTFLSRFTPSMIPPEVLEEIFVQRERLAARTVRQVHDGALSGPPAHVLFVGPRGIGKTHLISLIYHRLKADEELKGRLAVAWLPEDEAGVASFVDLLIAAVQALMRDEPGLSAWVPSRLDALYDHPTEAAAEALVREAVGDRALLLMVENLDDVFAGLGDAGQKALRAFLQETRTVTLLATAQNLFGGVSRHAAPFYGFFRMEHLGGLTLDEAIELLSKIAKLEEKPDLVSYLGTPAGRARVRAVDHLVAGNPRLYVIFSEFLAREQDLDELVPPFLDMLDDLTPYYQAKMRELSPQQRKIVDFLSGTREVLPVKEVARRTLIGASTVSSQLKQLRDLGYVRVAYAKGRETIYELKEPLMRLCLSVKKEREEPIRLFVEFLRVMYTADELERRLKALPGGTPFASAAYREALRLSATGENPLVAACRADYARYVEQGDQERVKQVLEEWQAIGGLNAPTLLKQPTQAERNGARQWLGRAKELFDLGRFEEALATQEQHLALDEKNAAAWNNKGVMLFTLRRYKEALTAVERSLALNPEGAAPWCNKGAALADLDKSEEALKALERCLTLDPEYVNAWSNKGAVLGRLGRFEEALEAYEQCLALDPTLAIAWYDKGVVLGNLNRLSEALVALEQSLNLNPHYKAAWYNKGLTLGNLARPDEALEAYEQCLTIDPKDADAWSNKGAELGKLGRFQEALAALNHSIILNEQDTTAWYNKGLTLSTLGQHKEALAAYEQCYVAFRTLLRVCLSAEQMQVQVQGGGGG